MPLTNLIKAAGVLTVGVLYFRATNHAVQQFQVSALKDQVRESKAIERSLDRLITKRIGA